MMLCCCGSANKDKTVDREEETPAPGKAGLLRVDTVAAAANIADPPPRSQEKRDSPQPASSPPDEEETGGLTEPPATPVGRDELALKRHRFFSDLMAVAEAQGEHRVRFDPRGPSFSGESEGEALYSGGARKELDSLVTRLEAVTVRLESTLAGLDRIVDLSPQSVCLQNHHFFSNEESGAVGGEELSSAEPSSPTEALISMAVAGYREIVAGPLASYILLSDKIGGLVAQQAQLVKNAFSAQLSYIETAGSRGEPSDSEKSAMLGPTSQGIQAIQELREKNRASPLFNHLSAVSESIPALGWVTVKPAPSPYVKEMSDAGQFYTNRVLKDWKEKDKTHVEWVKAWLETLLEMQRYVKSHHTTGLVWCGVGGGGASIPPPPGGPPPPPPPCLAGLDLSSDAGADDGRSALFAQINQGENITRSLKKVTSDMQTHKNPTLRSGPAPFKTGGGGGVGGAHAPRQDKPPVFNRDGKKWLIEHHKGNRNLVVEGAEMNNVVYIYNCTDSTVQIKGKINSVFVDSCKKTSVLFDTVVSSIEFVNCHSVQMQVLGKVPTVSIDKTNGCQIFLNKDALDVEIVSSTSTEMNVCVPKPNGDYAEYPIPEQLKTTIKKDGLETTLVENKG